MKSSVPFQTNLIESVRSYFSALGEDYAAAGTRQGREELRAQRSAVLLEAPTGVGKTYMGARIVSRLSRGKRILWFWFSPWDHLAQQTESALRTDAAGLQVADLESERQAAALSGSRVYSLVWASVAARGDVRRRRREADDGKQDLETFIAEARARGYEVGVVVDEAHHGVRGETEASKLLKDVLEPDYLLMLTATPENKDIQALMRFMQLTHVHRECVSRKDGVEARLIKPEIKVTLICEAEETRGYLAAGVPMEAVAIRQAVDHHESLKRALADAGVAGLTPLLLVQVGSSAEDAEANAQAALVAAGMPQSAVRVHTSNQPDEDLQAIADNPEIEALIFKMSVATGFNAPRAFTLVSTRASRSTQFGLQVLGRLLRVPAQLRALPRGKVPEMLTQGHAFLVDTASQEGLSTAAARIKEIKKEALTYGVQVVAVATTHGQEEPVADRELPLRSDLLILDLWTQTNVRKEIKGSLESQLADRVKVDPGLLEVAARDVVRLTQRSRGLFNHGEGQTRSPSFEEALDSTRIARQSLKVLGGLREVDLQALLHALRHRIAAEYQKNGHGEQARERLDRTVHLLGQISPRNPVHEALQELFHWEVGETKASRLPRSLPPTQTLTTSKRNVYGVIPSDEFDSPDEMQFAEECLEDEDAPLLWWHRNPVRKPWSVGLAKVAGGLWYPDFIVCVEGAETQDSLVLVEVKGEGWLQSAKVAEDFDTAHPRYGRPVFVTRVAGVWRFVQKQDDDRLKAGDRFSWTALRTLVRGPRGG